MNHDNQQNSTFYPSLRIQLDKDRFLRSLHSVALVQQFQIQKVANNTDISNTKTQSRGDRWYKRRETKEEAKCQEYIS